MGIFATALLLMVLTVGGYAVAAVVGADGR
jgi:hypothetical protein